MRRLKGSKELEARLKAIPREVIREIRPALVKGAQEIADAAEALAPERDGDLVTTITAHNPGDTIPPLGPNGESVQLRENQAAVTAGSEDVFYPGMQEFGTEHHEAQPFMRPAFRLKKDRVQRRINAAVRKAIKGQSR